MTENDKVKFNQKVEDFMELQSELEIQQHLASKLPQYSNQQLLENLFGTQRMGEDASEESDDDQLKLALQMSNSPLID